MRIRRVGFAAIYQALQGVDMAFLRADRLPWLAVLSSERLLPLLAAAVGEKALLAW